MTSPLDDQTRADQLDRFLDYLSISPGASIPPGINDAESELYRVAATVLSTAPRSDPEALARLRGRVLFPNGKLGGVSAPVSASSPSFDTSVSRTSRWLMFAAALLIVFAGVVGYLAVSGQSPFGSGGDGNPTLIPAALPPTDGGQAVAPPVPTQTPTPTEPVEIVPTMATGMLEEPFRVTISLRDIFYVPSTISVPANVPVEFLLGNEGAAPHTFTIDEADINVEVAPGEEVLVGLSLAPGSYDVYCAIPGHREAGMVGQIIAVDAGVSAPDDLPTEEDGSASASDAKLVLRDIRYDPLELHLPAMVTSVIEVVNEGAAPHNVTINGLAVSVDVPPGETRYVTVSPLAGTYDIYCDVIGHREAGMTAVLIAK